MLLSWTDTLFNDGLLLCEDPSDSWGCCCDPDRDDLADDPRFRLTINMLYRNRNENSTDGAADHEPLLSAAVSVCEGQSEARRGYSIDSTW